MGIRLLNKNEIVQARNIDRSREIAEGLKISRRVDSLRELMTQEEQTLAKFRNESLAAITKETEDATAVKQLLLVEINELRAEKAKGLKQVEQGLLSIASFRKTLDELEESLLTKSREIEKKEVEVTLNIRNSQDELLRAKNHKDEAEKLHKASLEDRKDARLVLMTAQNTEDQSRIRKEKVERELSLREGNVIKREGECALREQSTNQVLEEVATEKLRIIDREATLEREFLRIKKNERT